MAVSSHGSVRIAPPRETNGLHTHCGNEPDGIQQLARREVNSLARELL
jgi:hypothetical protein